MMVGRTAWMLIAAACFAGCASSGPVEEEEQELLGKPPTPQTDPFFYVARLPASARAESTGMIGEPADEARLKEPEPEEKPEVTAEPATTDEIAKFRERLARAEAALDEVKAKNLALSAQAVELSGRALELESQLAAAKAAEEEARAKAAHAEARAARPRPEPKPEPRPEPEGGEPLPLNSPTDQVDRLAELATVLPADVGVVARHPRFLRRQEVVLLGRRGAAMAGRELSTDADAAEFFAKHWRWLETNDGLCRMLGYSMRELHGIAWGDVVHPEDRDRVLVGEDPRGDGPAVLDAREHHRHGQRGGEHPALAHHRGGVLGAGVLRVDGSHEGLEPLGGLLADTEGDRGVGECGLVHRVVLQQQGGVAGVRDDGAQRHHPEQGRVHRVGVLEAAAGDGRGGRWGG